MGQRYGSRSSVAGFLSEGKHTTYFDTGTQYASARWTLCVPPSRSLPLKASRISRVIAPRRECLTNFGHVNSASARGVTGIARERRSKRHKAHTHILFGCRPKRVPRDTAVQHWCNLSAGLPSDLAMAKAYLARLEQTMPRKQRLAVPQLKELASTFSLCSPVFVGALNCHSGGTGASTVCSSVRCRPDSLQSQ